MKVNSTTPFRHALTHSTPQRETRLTSLSTIAFTPAGGPADFSGEIIDESGLKVGFITTAHEGRGRGTFNEGFIPKAGALPPPALWLPLLPCFMLAGAPGHQYSVRVTAPSGITKLKELPAVKADGAFVSSDSDVYTYDTSLALKVPTCRIIDNNY